MIKTSQLIKMLLEEDPNDECYVCVGNHPVRWVERAPYYYDGRMEYVERNENHKPIKVGYKAGTDKLKIHYDTIEDALMDNPDAELETSGITYQGQVNEMYMSPIRAWQQEGRDFQEWKRQLDEAHKLGKEPPPIVIRSEAHTLQGKMETWLRSIGLIK